MKEKEKKEKATKVSRREALKRIASTSIGIAGTALLFKPSEMIGSISNKQFNGDDYSSTCYSSTCYSSTAYRSYTEYCEYTSNGSHYSSNARCTDPRYSSLVKSTDSS